MGFFRRIVTCGPGRPVQLAMSNMSNFVAVGKLDSDARLTRSSGEAHFGRNDRGELALFAPFLPPLHTQQPKSGFLRLSGLAFIYQSTSGLHRYGMATSQSIQFVDFVSARPLSQSPAKYARL